MSVYYKKGYCYQLDRAYSVLTPIYPDEDIIEEWYSLLKDGTLTAVDGYAWNGANDPTIDTKNSISPSLEHDVLCQCMKTRKLDYSKWAPHVHAFFEAQLRKAGMWGFRASYWHWAVRLGQGGNPDIPDDVLVLEAP